VLCYAIRNMGHKPTTIVGVGMLLFLLVSAMWLFVANKDVYILHTSLFISETVQHRAIVTMVWYTRV